MSKIPVQMVSLEEAPLIQVLDCYNEVDCEVVCKAAAVAAADLATTSSSSSGTGHIDQMHPTSGPTSASCESAAATATTKGQDDDIILLDALDSLNNEQLYILEPIVYTPKHPSLLPKIPPPPKPVTRATRSKAAVRRQLNGSNDPLQQGLQHSNLRPATIRNNNLTRANIIVPSSQQPTSSAHCRPTVCPPNPPQSETNRCRPLSKGATIPIASNNLLFSSANPFVWTPPVYQARFGDQPNFSSAHGSRVPSQSLFDWPHPYANIPILNNNITRAPAPAHSQASSFNNPNNRPPIPCQHAESQVGSNPLPYQFLDQVLSRPQPQSSSNPQPNLPKFVPQAQPVRSAYQDFLKQVQSTLPNVDTNELYRQITSNQSQRIQLPVPNGANPAHWQRLLQNQLESAMLQTYTKSNAVPTSLSTLGDMINTINNVKQPRAQAVPPKPPPTEDDMAIQDREVEANHDEEYQDIETYADYAPSKLKIGKPHPDPVVETSSLATVEPPDIYYKLKLPSKIIDNGLLSALQLESVIYASQQHETFAHGNETRRGFLIGDGAGVGKGRTIAGIIYENYMRGRKKAIWFSVSPDLKLDAERDLRDLGSKIQVYALNKFDYGRRINLDSGVIFSTYSSLVGKSSRVRGALSTRIGQLIAWAGVDFDGVIVFDECHKAKNISLNQKKVAQSKTATYVLDLQERLPKARVVYASATGASETKQLGYMTRLGLWGEGTPYSTFSQFCETIEKRGVGAMELVAVDLKMRGSYIARQLSFKTTQFTIRTATIDDSFVALYDECVDLWAKALNNFREAEGYFRDDKSIKTMWSSFWGAHQKFFKYLCIGSKVPLVVQIAKEALKDGKCVVIGLQSTGESKTNEALEEGDINEFLSTAKATFESLIENHFPAPRNTSGQTKREPAESGIVGHAKSSDEDSWPQLDEFSPKNELEDHNYTDTSSRFCKNKKALEELAAEKRKQQQAKNPRTGRAKRRAAERLGYKSRIKFSADEDDQDPDFELESSSETDSESDLSSKSNSDQTVIILSSSEDESDEPHLQRKLFKNIHNSMIDDDDDCLLIESGRSSSDDDPMVRYGKRLTDLKNELLSLVNNLGPKLPNNTLDDLIDRLGGPSQVAEMTGRKGRIVKDEETGQISYKCRNETDALDRLNIAEKERFMSGQKFIAIISEAASSGISLQADRRVENQLRRVHITIELPWSADRAIQQFGRTHRSNQVSGPEYVFVISELAGEKRFASIVAKRLESLGALTHGDRRANTETRDLSQFNIVSRYCRQALELLCRRVECGMKFADIEPDYKGDFLRDAREAFIGSGLARNARGIFIPEAQALQITHFLNRLLGMKVRIQNAIFSLFIDYMERLIARKKVVGQYDAGILELNSESGKTHCSPPENFYLKTKSGIVKCTLHNVQVERGISWNEAVTLLEGDALNDSRSGFYVSVNPLSKATMIFLLVREPQLIDSFRCYKPNTGRQAKPDFFDCLVGRGKKTDLDNARAIWSRTFDATKTQCIHVCYFKSCKRIEAKMKCEVGLRHRSFCIMSGGILTAWPYLEKKAPDVAQKLQIVRLKLDAGNRVIGPVIPQHSLAHARKVLKEGEKGVEF